MVGRIYLLNFEEWGDHMKRDATKSAMRTNWVRFYITLRSLTLVATMIGAVASSAFAQRFDDVVTDAVLTCGAPPMNPTGRLAAHCGAGVAGPSGGSTTALTNESSPVQERKFEKLMGPWNFYLVGDYEYFHKRITTFEPGYSNNIWRGGGGADYAISNNLVAGGALRYVHDDGDFRGGGHFSTASYGFLLHTNYVPAPGWFLDTNAGYLRRNYTIGRSVFFNIGAGDAFIGTARGKPDGNEVEVGANGGYNFNFQNVTIGPRVGLNYKYNEIDSYGEKGTTGLELIYNSQNEHSLTSVLGAQGTIALSTGIGVIAPQVLAEYVHEFMDPQRVIRFRFVDDLAAVHFRFQNDRPDRNYFNLGAGVVVQLARGITPFLNYRALVGYRDQSSHRVTAGLRMEF
jgi:uncharacterized protein YhjY with autotransporter beta-barrel domain